MKKLFYIFILIAFSNLLVGQVNSIFRTNSNDIIISKNGIYSSVNDINSTSNISQIGAPKLPVTTQSFALPAGAVLTNLSVTNGSKTQMGGG